jgi:ethanolamine phosphate transferase 2 subunit G
VTRHLDSELVSKDWDVLILHYLGLDHIGHLGGPRRYNILRPKEVNGLISSIYMKPKQSEMDGIIETIYNTFSTKHGERTLMVVCGDHGMNDVYSFD